MILNSINFAVIGPLAMVNRALSLSQAAQMMSPQLVQSNWEQSALGGRTGPG